jgi:ubiquinone/menaquinone biosynthesis C-methylase UbiE
MENSSLIHEQYADSKNFAARVELNRRFGTNPYRWTSWVFNQIKFPEDARVLELGCGNALLWRSNLSRIPNHSHIILSDFSEGMLNDAKNVLNDSVDKFEFKVINADQIPYSDGLFDIVIANYMLYHIPDLDKALSEISRVLKTSGTFYAATFGLDYMKELTELVSHYDDNISFSLRPLARAFGLENGTELLGKYFKDVKMMKYYDNLEVTKAEPLVNYILSTKVNKIIKKSNKGDFMEYVINILKNRSKIEITKESYLFIAQKPKIIV